MCVNNVTTLKHVKPYMYFSPYILWTLLLLTFCARNNPHPTLHQPPTALSDYTFIFPGPSLQLLPSCPGSTVTTGTERRWHPGSPSLRSGWKRSWSATGLSASGTGYRPQWSRCRLRGSTRTVSLRWNAPGFLS